MKNQWLTKVLSAIVIVMLAMAALPVTPAMAADTGFFNANQTVASNSVANPNNGWTSNNQYATFNAGTDTADYGYPDLGIPAGAVIDGIEVTIEAQRNGGGANRNLNAALWNASSLGAYSTAQTAVLGNNDTVVTLGGPTDKWGTTWTTADFADATFRIRVGVPAVATGDADLDAVRVRVYYTDSTPPTLNSFTTQNPATSPTSSNALTFRATFSEDVQNVSTADFTVTGTTATVQFVNQINGSTYDITVFGGNLNNLNGTVGLNLSAGQNITDLSGNPLPNTEPATDETYVVDNTAPTAISFTRLTPATNPTNADVLIFRVVFNEDVQNVSTGDFDATGTTAGVTNVTMIDASTYDVTISGGNLANYNGTAGLDFDITGGGQQNIQDLAGNDLPSAQPSIQETYTVDNIAPTVTINQAAGQADPTSNSPINFTVVFSEAPTGFATGDVSFTGSTAGGVLTGTVSGGPTTYTVAVTGMTTSGNVIASINAGVAADAAGNNNAAATFTDHTVTFVAKINTTTTVSCVPSPVIVFADTTCTVTVTRVSGGSTPSGTVTLATDGSGAFTPANTCALSGAGASATCAVTYTPSGVGTGSHNISAVYGGDATFNGSNGNQGVTVNKETPIVSWSNPADITYGTALSATQLNATASVAGTFTYTPASGTVLNAGNGQVLSVDFAPTDSANYNDVLGTAVNINVLKATPIVSWSNPADITYNTALSATQLNATASVAGTFTYTPASGTVLNAGNGQVLSVDFAPTDSANYNDVLGTTVNINVLKDTPIITWNNPADITYGTALSATQLNATASVAGTFTYTPASGTVLNAGNGQVLSVDFVPTDSANYNDVLGTTVNINVLKDTPIITWNNPADITYGTALSATQLNATASVAGTFTYTPASGTVLNAGNGQVLSVDFVPTDSANYNSVLGTTVNINVLKDTPIITWNNPADITYGTALSATQLNATASVAGTFTYTPASGTVLNAGNGQVLSVDFVPTDSANYNSVLGTTVNINVLKATPIVSWSNPADITYNAALSATQLNATASVAGTFTYTPASGTILNAGNGQVLSVDFTPTDSTNYTAVLGTTVNINVLKATVTPSIIANNKIYDGGLTASFTCSLAGVIGVDNVSCTGGTANFADMNIGTWLVTANGLGLSGAESGNYQLSSTSATDSADITQRTLNVTANGVDKAYDGNTTATVTLLDDRVAGDDVTTTYTSASFVDPNVNTNITVNVSGISITGGADSGNYTLGNTTTTTTANITITGQTINVTLNAPASATNGTTFDVAATASSGLLVTITTSGSCSGGDTDGTATITMTSGIGVCNVFYDQAGDTNYSPAPQIQENANATQGPSITSANSAIFDLGLANTFTVTTTGNPATPMTITLTGTLPTGISFVDNGDGTATLSGIPAVGTEGNYPLTFEADNDILPNGTQSFTLTVKNGPIISANGINSVPDTGNGSISENETFSTTLNVTQLLVTFSQDVNDPAGDTDPKDVTNPANYLLVRGSSSGVFQTVDCKGGVVSPDFPISVDSVTYSNGGGSGPFVSTLNINSGLPLNVAGFYRLYVCGTTSIVDAVNPNLVLAGNGTTPDTDFLRNFRMRAPVAAGGGGGGGGGGAGKPVNNFASGVLIPVTGFTPGQVTQLPPQTKENIYSSNDDMRIEIPSLSLNMPIVGVSLSKTGWDVSRLGNNAGYLEGSAYPTWKGNTVLTGHFTDVNGKPGPFAYIGELKAGDKVYIHNDGFTYVYEVRESDRILPTNISTLFKHEEFDWITLVTCEDYSTTLNKFVYRRIVRAALISVIPEK